MASLLLNYLPIAQLMAIETNYFSIMKVKRLIVVLLLLWDAAVAQQSANSAQTNALSAFNHSHQISGREIITREGMAYKNVMVQKVVPDGLVIAYSLTDGGIGIAKLKFKDLSADLQQQFGYNFTNAATFEKEQKQAEGQWRAQWIADDEKVQSKRHAAEIAEAEAEASAMGTGFFITDDGYLLTCFHVVNNATSIMVGTTHGLFPAELVQSDPVKDVALLKVTGSFASLPLVSSNTVRLGESVFTIGFPNPNVQGLQPKLTRGDISGLSGAQDDPDQYQISVPVQPGNSGGALLDENGNVVGIVATRLSDWAAVATSGMTAENVNYAVKSSCAKTFLDAASEWPVKLKSPHLSSDDRKFDDVVQASQDAVALVLVQYNDSGRVLPHRVLIRYK
jgi:S1-C subfamily serine protease